MIHFSWLQLGLIGVAGATGAVARYVFGRFIAERVSSDFPLGTFLINISGAFLIGLLAGLVGHKVLGPSVQVVLATGFLGGYTTFSTMHWEGVQLLRMRRINSGVVYLGGTYALGLLLVVVGMLLGGWL